MLKNLYKEWSDLAPNEVTFWDNGEAITLQKNQPPCRIWVAVNPSLDEQDALQGYIQRCALARRWTLHAQISPRFCACEVQVGDDYYHQDRNDSDIVQTMLTAYLEAIAASDLSKTGE